MVPMDREVDDCRPSIFRLSSPPACAARPEAARAANRVSCDLSPRGLNLPSGFNSARADLARVGVAPRGILDARE